MRPRPSPGSALGSFIAFVALSYLSFFARLKESEAFTCGPTQSRSLQSRPWTATQRHEWFDDSNLDHRSRMMRLNFIRSGLGGREYQDGVCLLVMFSNANQQEFESAKSQMKRSPTPVMPSILFQELALSQLELLASSVLVDNEADDNASYPDATSEDENASSTSGTTIATSKIKSMAVYLPQENSLTGQLEFLPAVLYPHPKKERVFIANDSDSGMAPEIPKLLTKLPGFAHATSLIPRYPMLSKAPDEQDEATAAGVGVVEEVLCDVKSGGTALSVPLLAGSQTVGVLLVSPDQSKCKHHKHKRGSIWTDYDRQQVARAAKSLSLALSMDTERLNARLQNHQVREALSDSLHQFKNPLQALRTYGKLLQRRMATNPNDDGAAAALTPQTLELAQHLLVQSDRLVERLKPVDAIVDAMRHESSEPLQRSLHQGRLLALNPVEAKALVPWSDRRTTPKTKNSLVRPGWVAAQQAVSEPINVTDSFRSGRSSGTATRDDTVPPYSNQTVAVHNAMTGAWYQTSSQRPAMTSSTSLSSSNFPCNALLGDVRLEMSFVPDVLDPVWAIFRDIANDREIQFSVQEDDELPGVMIWPLALQEAVINLLDNAFKYVVLSSSPPEQRPRVRVRFFPNNVPPNRRRPIRDASSPAPISPGVTMLVEDNGPGIPRHEQAVIFERGYRSESTAHVADGSGIGLAIARSLIEQMGGTLRVVDNDGYNDCLSGAVLELVVFRKPNVD
jgi:signal transduction histidine kinase